MTKIHINIGSNIDRNMQITRALKSLHLIFSNITLSCVYESQAVGFDGDNFYNIGVNAHTTKTISEVQTMLYKIENKQGRSKKMAKFSARIIDLDLILYDDVVDKDYNLPRDEILKYAFVLAPLAELNPDERHPVLKKTYTELWQMLNNKFMAKIIQYNRSILKGELL